MVKGNGYGDGNGYGNGYGGNGTPVVSCYETDNNLPAVMLVVYLLTQADNRRTPV